MRDGIADGGPAPEGLSCLLQIALAYAAVQLGALPPAVLGAGPGEDPGPRQPALLHQPGG
ncbi:MAG: hypothetical protein EA413_01050 [Cyanobium sp. PLM2.Bin73]|nr:MAG: hypothetical protein EA413_01050 [Cyanobium sp. PLM2.Bin73]